MDHPCKGMSKVQVETFERVAIGETPPATRKTWDSLEKAGVIKRGPDKMARDALGEFGIPQWQIPIHIHAQWCAWCAETFENDMEQPK